MKKSILFFALSVVVSLDVYATQYFNPVEHSKISARVSDSVINRISVEEDSITSFVCSNNTALELKKNESSGDLFVSVLEKQTAPITLFLSTEQGKTFELLLTPEPCEPENIIIGSDQKGESLKFDDYKTSEQSYLTEIKELLTAMHNQDASKFPSKKISISFPKVQNLAVKNKQGWQSARFSGVVCEILNNTTEIVLLEPENFRFKGVKAVSILTKELIPQAKTLVYLIHA